MLSFPLTVHWNQPDGGPEDASGKTVSVNRHGARIEVTKALPPGQLVTIRNRSNRREGLFRVAGLLSPVSNQGAVYGVVGPVIGANDNKHEHGVESLEPRNGFWGIYFPPLAQSDSAEARALLECQQCKTVALLRLSLVEVDVLETAGILSWQCSNCKMITSWAYAEKDRKIAVEPQGFAPSVPKGLYGREHRRVSLQVPVLIRRYGGQVEISQTEDVSKGGFAFSSDADYVMGEGLMVACPYNAAGPNAEVQAQIARKQDLRGTNCKIYGVRYVTAEG
jgi:hypothetical protein